jgi:hypothetical protein
MIIDSNLILEEFYLENIPPWKCPQCNIGVLSATKENIKHYEYTDSIDFHDHEAWEPGFIRGNFIGLLSCSNIKCKGKTIFAGEMIVDSIPVDIDEPPYHIMDYGNLLIPKYFNPPLEIVPIPKKLNEKIESSIKESFNLFWIDSSACANKIRVIVESMMDELKIPKSRLNSSRTKRIKYSLHKRIELFKQKNKEVGELLLAIKWIGNEGSHELNILKKVDIILAFEILHQCLDKIYNKIPSDLKKKVKEINRRKGIKNKR